MEEKKRGTAGNTIVDLRQYTARPGRRDAMIAIFERDLIEVQEASGMTILDLFRDLDDPDRFVWLRGFPDMATRLRSQEAFYASVGWAKHRKAFNAASVDHSDVLMLRSASPTSGYPVSGKRPPSDATEIPATLVVVCIYHVDPASEEAFPAVFDRVVAPALTEAGATILATYVTEHSPNNYPRVEIREGEHVFVWFARFADSAAYARHCDVLARSSRWQGEIAPTLAACTVGTPEVRRLAPTARSPLRV